MRDKIYVLPSSKTKETNKQKLDNNNKKMLSIWLEETTQYKARSQRLVHTALGPPGSDSTGSAEAGVLREESFLSLPP